MKPLRGHDAVAHRLPSGALVIAGAGGVNLRQVLRVPLDERGGGERQALAQRG